MPKAKDICQLRTPFEKGTADAWQEYPRPQFRRSSYIPLCGRWELFVKPDTEQMRCISESLKTAFENITKE